MSIRRHATRFAVGLGLCMSLLSGATAQTLKIGVIGPLTGGGAQWGMAAAEGAKILAAEVNAKGGIDVGGKKQRVEVIAYDDQYKAAEALAAYNRLVNNDGAKYVIVVVSPPTILLAPKAETDKVLLLTAAGVEKAVDPKSKNVFRILSIFRDYVPLVIGWVKDNIPGRRVVIVGPNDELGWASAELSETSYKKYGFELLNRELFERTQKDFAPMLTKVIAMQPDIIDFSGAPPATAGLIVRQARELGYKGRFLKTAGASTKEIIEAAGKEGAEGTISLHLAHPASEGYKRLAAEYRKSVGQQPDDLITVFYDATNALVQAIQKAGDVNDTAKVSAAFLSRTFPLKSIQGDELTLGGAGAGGDPNQIMTVSYISVIKNGEPVIVGKVR